LRARLWSSVPHIGGTTAGQTHVSISAPDRRSRTDAEPMRWPSEPAGELRASGIRVRRPTRSGPESLTPSERRVAELVIAGSSNREAAQALFVTEKTVETHLAGVYRKLSIHSRRELTTKLAEGQVGASASVSAPVA
jgi:DNA-binding NarL/FixJ family response regulator